MADGEINRICKGKKISGVFHDNRRLLIQLEDGHEIQVRWQDQQGNVVEGIPVLSCVNVKVTLEPTTAMARAASL